MGATNAPKVLAVYPVRAHADQLVALLREHGVRAAAVPSGQHSGEWDVLVSTCDTSRAFRMVKELLDLD